MKEDSDRVPHSMEAERAVLGAILQHRDAIIAVAPLLGEGEALYRPAHQKLYQAMLACYLRREPPDLVTVTAELEQRGQLEAVGGLAYLAGLSDAVPTAVHVEYYAGIVRDLAERRALIRAAGQIAALGYGGNGNGTEGDASLLRAKALKLLTEQGAPAEAAVGLGQSAMETLDELQQQASGNLWMPTFGLERFDDGLSLRPGSVTIIGGRTSEGKTVLAMQLAERTARMGGHALFISTEMPRVDLVRRMICAHWPEEGEGLMTFKRLCEKLSEHDQAVAGEVLARLSTLKERLRLHYCRDIDQIRLQAMYAQAHDQLDLLVIDYLQRLEAEGKDRYHIVTRISNTLFDLAADLRVPIVATSQLSRASLGKDEPEVSDLKESGSQEQDATAVILLRRDEKYGGNVMRPVQWWRKKNRNGPLADGALLLNTARFTFEQEL